MKHIDITIYGKVQGVFFRASAKAVADLAGVKGHAKNQKDGSVFIEAEAETMILAQFVEWCHKGPRKAIVEKVEVADGELKNYRNFEVLKKV